MTENLLFETVLQSIPASKLSPIQELLLVIIGFHVHTACMRNIMRIQGCLTQNVFLFVNHCDVFPGGPTEPIEERAGMDLSWAHLSGHNRAESTRVKTTARCGCSSAFFIQHFYAAQWLEKINKTSKGSQQTPRRCPFKDKTTEMYSNLHLWTENIFNVFSKINK